MKKVRHYRDYNDYISFQSVKTKDPEKRKKWLGEEWDLKIQGFKKEFSKSKDNAMIKYVLSRLKNNHLINSEENIKSEKEKYFQFRNTLLSKSNVTVDSSMVKNFIL